MRLQDASRQIIKSLRNDWQGSKYIALGLALLVITSLVVAAYYLNHPQVEVHADTASYLAVTQRILTQGQFVDKERLPGYPAMVALVYLVAGAGNLAAVSIVQGILFVVATLEVYVITCMIVRRAWVALIVGLLVGTNIFLLSYVKPIIAEGLSPWLLTTFALVVLLFIRSGRLSLFWLVVGCLFVVFMTRPEWIYLPVPLFAYFLLVAARRGRFRRLLPHTIAAVIVLYALVGLFIYENGVQNGYVGLTIVQPVNLLGKVMQYRMQNEAPGQYANVTQQINVFLAHPLPGQGDAINPWAFGEDVYPPIAADNWALANRYATTIILQHPFQFAWDTVPVFLFSSNETTVFRTVDSNGPLAEPLLLLQKASTLTTKSYLLFPLFALFWLVLLFWRRTARQPGVELMGAVMLLALYGLALTSVGGYTIYSRLHSPFDALMLIVIWGTALGSQTFWPLLRRPGKPPETGKTNNRENGIAFAAQPSETGAADDESIG